MRDFYGINRITDQENFLENSVYQEISAGICAKNVSCARNARNPMREGRNSMGRSWDFKDLNRQLRAGAAQRSRYM
jgi:hypothetical protein